MLKRCENTASGVHRIRDPFDYDYMLTFKTLSLTAATSFSREISSLSKVHSPLLHVLPMSAGSDLYQSA